MTVAVLTLRQGQGSALREADLEWKMTRGSGAGGQNRNKVESAVVLRHVPTGTTVRVETERSQHQNRRLALELMAARLEGAQAAKAKAAEDAQRRAQVGSGMRGDKVRTIALQRDEAVDHRNGKRMNGRDYLRGRMDELW